MYGEANNGGIIRVTMLVPTPSLEPELLPSPNKVNRSRSASTFVNSHFDKAGLTHLIEFRPKNNSRKRVVSMCGAFVALLSVCLAHELFLLVSAIHTRHEAAVLRQKLSVYKRQAPLYSAIVNERTFTWLYVAGNRLV